MALSRFYDDDARVKKKLDESLNVGLYHLDTPGNGIKVPFLEDPQIRLQKWGANLRTNTMALDNDLRGLNRKLKNDQDTRYFDQDISNRKYEHVGKPKEPNAKWLQDF